MKNQPKSKAKQHGGKREGAGRKPKPRAPAIPLRMASSDATPQERARAYVDLAIETLASVAGEGASEAARVAAARVIIEIATGKTKTAQTSADSQQDGDANGWGDLIGQQPAGRSN
jgi:hypothetical protein